MQPINFAMDVRDPFESAVQGLQFGVGIRGAMDKQAEAERQRAQQAQMQADLSALASNPNAGAADYSRVMTLYPQLSEHFKRSWDVLSEGQQKSKLSQVGQVYSAISANKPELASQILKDQAAALRNAGNEAGAKEQEALARTIEMSPETARTTAGIYLSTILGPDKFAETFSKLGAEGREADKAPSELATSQANAREAGAKATTAEAKAKYADSEALLDLEKKGWDIKKVQSEIQTNKENSRIAAMNAAISRESNDLKRQELRLKIDEAVRDRDTKIREKVADVESARGSIDNMLNTVDRVLKNPSLNDVLGSMEGRMPSLFSDGKSDAIALIENLKSQTFLAQIPSIKGMGALSNAEGAKLESALQNLDRTQSEKQYRENLSEAQRLMLKARKNLAERYGVPDNIPDRPNAPAAQMPAGFKILGKE